MSKEYDNFLGSIGAGGGTARSGGITVKSFDGRFDIEGLYDDETGIDKEALKEEIGEEVAKRVEGKIEEILRNKEESKENKEQEIKVLLAAMLKEQEEERERRRLEFNNDLEEFNGLDIQELDKQYEEAVDNKKIIKKTRDKESNEVITEYKTDSGTTVIVNTGSVSHGKVSRWRYRIRKIRDTISISLLAIIFLSVVYLYFNPEKANEVGMLIESDLIPWLKESVLPFLGETLENTIGEGIDNFLEWYKGR